MIDNDPYFQSPILKQSSSQGAETHNEALARIVAANGRLKGIDASIPPNNPDTFDTYLIKDPVAGTAWEGLDGWIAVYVSGWKYLRPQPGFRLTAENANTSGQAGRIMDYWQSNWSSTGGVQSLTPEEVTPGVWEVNKWDLKYGQTGRVTLSADTTIARPVGFRYGRMLALIVRQDGVGGHALTFKPGQFLAPGGTVPPPTLDANAETSYVFLNMGPSYAGPALLAVASDLRTVT